MSILAGATEQYKRLCCKDMKEENLPRWRIDNLWAFLVAVVTAVFSFAALYFGLSTEIKLNYQNLANKIDFQTQLLEEHKITGDKDKTTILSALNELERRLSFLEGSKDSDSPANIK